MMVEVDATATQTKHTTEPLTVEAAASTTKTE